MKKIPSLIVVHKNKMRLLAADAWSLLNVPDSSANSLRRYCPDQVKGTPRNADLSLTAPLFLCPPTKSRRGTKSQARRHNPPRRCVAYYTIAKLERREGDKADPEQRAAVGSTLLPTTPRCGQALRLGAASPMCTRTLMSCGCAASVSVVAGQVRAVLARTRPSATCGEKRYPRRYKAASKFAAGQRSF